MLDGVNDKPEHAQAARPAAARQAGEAQPDSLQCFSGHRYRRSPAAAIVRFRDILNELGVIATIRKTRAATTSMRRAASWPAVSPIAPSCGSAAGSRTLPNDTRRSDEDG
jgi:hypothetical protein